jgi:hypothetical protein
MTTHANVTFEVKSWDEKTWDGRPWNEVTGAKFTRASIVNVFHGDIEGESHQESLMAYREDGTVDFVGLEHVVGQVGGRSGSFVLKHNGTVVNGVVAATYTVIPGFGTGELSGLRGEGSTRLEGHAAQYPFPFDFHFE